MKKAIKAVQKVGGLDKFAGKWIAMVDNEIIAWGENLVELEKKIKEVEIPQEPVYFLVPRKDEGPYILFCERYIYGAKI